MMKQYTVEQRAAIAKEAMPKPAIDAEQWRQVRELLYTLRESGDLPRLEDAHAALLWGVVELVKAGGFTDEMRL